MGKSVREQKVEEKREKTKEKKFQTGPKFQKSKKEVNAYQKPLKNIGLHPPPKKEELRLKKSPQKKEQDLDLVPVKLLPQKLEMQLLEESYEPQFDAYKARENHIEKMREKQRKQREFNKQSD